MTDEFILMAEDCIRFAREGLSAKDYKEFCKRMLGPGTSYYDRIRVSERLIDERVIYVEDNKLHLGELGAQDWLVSGLAQGKEGAWKIVDSFPKRRLKFDPENCLNAEIGLAGEAAVMGWLGEQLDAAQHSRVQHVSLENDAAGYDIFSPSTRTNATDVLLEVKTTSRPGSSIQLFLSRNEADIGLKNTNWFLVVVKIRQGIPQLEGYISMAEIQLLLPVDPTPETRWMNVRLELLTSALTYGLP